MFVKKVHTQLNDINTYYDFRVSEVFPAQIFHAGV